MTEQRNEERSSQPFSVAGCRRHIIANTAAHGDGKYTETYCVDLFVPAGKAPQGGWPVIVMLDAAGCFATCVEAMGRMGRRRDATGVGQAIIAGISSPDGGYDVARRQRDFTSPRIESQIPPRPTKSILAAATLTDEESTAAPTVSSQSDEQFTSQPISQSGPQDPPAILPSAASGGRSGRDLPNGGAAQFLDFIERDVLPFIAARHPVNPQQHTLFGHSLAGYFTLWAMLNRPQLFRNYAAISPSLWWDWQGVKAAAHNACFSGQRMMIAVGEWEEALPPWHLGREGSDEILARRKGRRMIANAREMAHILSERPGQDDVRFYELVEEDHASIVSVAVVRMLRLAFLP